MNIFLKFYVQIGFLKYFISKIIKIITSVLCFIIIEAIYMYFPLHTPKLLTISLETVLSSHLNIQRRCFTADDSKR